MHRQSYSLSSIFYPQSSCSSRPSWIKKVRVSTQKHIIKRQIIELKAGDPAEAQALQAELSRIFRHRIIPLLDRCCTQASAPDRVHRIERLELDLGRVDPRCLEAELVARLGELLPAALAEQISAHERAAAQRG